MFDQFAQVELAHIATSLTNPRKHFDADGLQELADSIKDSGVHQPVLLRPLPGSRAPDTDRGVVYELVAGERRYRACKLAGLDTIPAMIRALTDDQVMEIQIVENLQRIDLTELEEAEGFAALMQHSGLTADQVGEKIGKSRSSVYARLKLLDLCQEARGSLRDRTIDASRALLVARIPDHKLQIKAMKEIVEGHYGYSGRDPMTYRSAAEHVQRNYMLKLSDARFNITAIDLVPEAGSCKTCTKRTGHDPDLFSDVKGADVCTDPTCFHKKEQAHEANQVNEAKAKGQTVITGKEAHEIAMQPLYSGTKFKGYKRLDSAEDSPTDQPLRKIIGAQMKAEGIKPVMIAHPTKKGEMVECLPNEVAGRLLKTVEGQAAAAKKVTKEVKAMVDEKKAKAEAKLTAQFDREWRANLVRDAWCEIRDDADVKPFDIKVQRLLAVREARNLSTEDCDAVCRILNIGKVGAASGLVDHIKECPSPQSVHLLMLMQSASGPDDRTYDFGGTVVYNEALMLVAGNVFGTQLDNVIKEIKAEVKDKLWPKVKKTLPTTAPLAQPKPAAGLVPKKQASAARAPRMSAQEALSGIASAMQGVEGASAAPKGAVASPATPAGAREIRYKGPNGETWTGRGLMPKWLRHLVEAGQDKESFAVPQDTKPTDADQAAAEENDLYDQAVALVTREQKASKRLLKEELSIGQDKALALLERMEMNGVVSAVDETRNRKVLVAA
jgi:ParB/RepB/Spo0J family partition protein